MAFEQSLKLFNQKTITKIAENVTDGIVSKHWRDSRGLTYLSFAVPTGTSAPDESEILIRGRKMFENNQDDETINSSEPIDVYVYANSEDQYDSVKARLVVQA